MGNSNTTSNIPWILAWNTANTNSDILDLLETSKKLGEALVKSGLLKDSDVKKILDFQEKSFNKWKIYSFWVIIFSSPNINREKFLDFIASRWIKLTEEEQIKIVETSPAKANESITSQQEEIITRTEKILEKTKIPKKQIWEALIEAHLITRKNLEDALKYKAEKAKDDKIMMVGEILMILGFIDRKKFLNFIKSNPEFSMKTGELLVANNLIDWEQLENAMALQRDWEAKWTKKQIWDILVEDMWILNKERLLKIVAQQKNMIRIKPSISWIDPKIFLIFKRESEKMKSLNFIPYKIFETYKNEDSLWKGIEKKPEISGYILTVLSDDCRWDKIEEIKREINRKKEEIIRTVLINSRKKEEIELIESLSLEIVFEYATKDEITPFIDECNKNEGVFIKMSKEMTAPKQDHKSASGVFTIWKNFRSETNDNLNKFADILIEAINKWASDIHIEPEEDRVRIRARVDWVLEQIWELPIQISKWFTSSIKNYFGFADSWRNNEIYDERISAYYDDKDIKVDIRFSLMPTNFWETIVARILVQKDIIQSVQELWMRPNIARKYELVTVLPSGIIIITWPTWSGKTTTIYSTIASLNSDEKNIITVENPIEYVIKWANQVDAGWKNQIPFATIIKAILRQDPDILMFWEMRDLNSAKNAIETGLTGRLLLSTLHTNDAISAIDRLINLWIEPFFLGSTLVSLVGQRLIRKICPHCTTDYTPNENDLSYLKRYVKDMDSYIKEHKIKFKKWKGCEQCNNTWYKWRVSIVELFCVNEELKKAVVDRKTAAELETIARRYGMTSMAEDWFCRVIEWETTLEEVLKVVRTNQFPKQKRTMEEIQRLLYWEMSQQEIENAVYGESMDEKSDINEQIVEVLKESDKILKEWIAVEAHISENQRILIELARKQEIFNEAILKLLKEK